MQFDNDTSQGGTGDDTVTSSAETHQADSAGTEKEPDDADPAETGAETGDEDGEGSETD